MGAPTSIDEQRELTSGESVSWLVSIRRVLAPTLISALTFWVAIGTISSNENEPESAIYVLGFVLAIVAVVSGLARQRLSLSQPTGRWTEDELPDALGALYLATLVLVNTRVAIVFAIATPLVTYAASLRKQGGRGVAVESLIAALWRGALWSLTLLAAGATYVSVATVIQPRVQTSLRAHVFGALAAAVVTLAALLIIRLTRVRSLSEIPQALARSTHGQWVVYQAMLLCCIPLLPMTQSLDPVELEFSWALLLAPMGAVYYLGLTSARLTMRTAELQETIAALNEARARESELMNYAALITRAQEDERRRLARDLHDDTAQALIALSRGLEALSSHINPTSSPADARFVADLIDLTGRTLESVRRACHDLRPSVLDDLGLSPALDSLAASMEQRGLPCAFVERGEPQTYSTEVEVAAYRVAQEALSNVVRHAHATRATLELSHRPEGLCLVVTDDGDGFAPDDLRKDMAKTKDNQESGSGLGMLGMRERALLIGAQLSVESAPRRGSRVILDVPIAQSATRGGNRPISSVTVQ